MEEVLGAAVGGNKPEPLVSDQSLDRAVHPGHESSLLFASSLGGK
jgi:hypothetical protein